MYNTHFQLNDQNTEIIYTVKTSIEYLSCVLFSLNTLLGDSILILISIKSYPNYIETINKYLY